MAYKNKWEEMEAISKRIDKYLLWAQRLMFVAMCSYAVALLAYITSIIIILVSK